MFKLFIKKNYEKINRQNLFATIHCMKIPKPISDVIDSFSRLPGIGPKSAQRLAYYLLYVPQRDLDNFSDAIKNVKHKTKLCTICKNISESEICPVCDDVSRDKNTILVIEQALDILVFEKTGKYKGVYHVLHGSINPLENIGPDELYMKDLISRVDDKTNEIIIATNPTMEGEATAMYIKKQLENFSDLKVTRIGMGIPTGAYVEFADEMTILQSMEGRRTI